MPEHSENVKKYIDRIFSPDKRKFSCNAETPEEFAAWQKSARAEYRTLLKLLKIEEGASGHTPSVEMEGDAEDCGNFTRQLGKIETEPDVWVAFWLLKPKGDGPFPLAVTPHGHGSGDVYAGVYKNEEEKEGALSQDRDVAVQAAERGFLAVAPATRGIGQNPRAYKVGDIDGRHDGRDCRCHNWNSILAGRVLTGERVWDMMKIIDWAQALPETDNGTVLMMGNSGGGMVTLYTAAADERVTIAVCSSAFNVFVKNDQSLLHCPCNYIPNIMEFGEFWDVAGLVAPRYLQTVNGVEDSLHSAAELEYASSELKRIYTAAGVPAKYEHALGSKGHQFYKDLMWQFIDKVMKKG